MQGENRKEKILLMEKFPEISQTESSHVVKILRRNRSCDVSYDSTLVLFSALEICHTICQIWKMHSEENLQKIS